MKHRSFWTQFGITGIPCGIGMALLWWWFGWLLDTPTNFLFILSFGLLSAVWFGLILTFYERWRWGQLESTESPTFWKTERVIMSTPAFHGSNNGWLALTGDGFLFKVKSPNYHDLRIRFSDIVSIRDWTPTGSSGSGLRIDLASGKCETFEIEDIAPWRNLVAGRWSRKPRIESGGRESTAIL